MLSYPAAIRLRTSPRRTEVADERGQQPGRLECRPIGVPSDLGAFGLVL